MCGPGSTFWSYRAVTAGNELPELLSGDKRHFLFQGLRPICTKKAVATKSWHFNNPDNTGEYITALCLYVDLGCESI